MSIKSYNLDVLAPEAIKVKVTIKGKEYCASPVLTTHQRIEFDILKDNPDGLSEEDLSRKIAEYFVLLFKPHHPEIDADFFLTGISEVKLNKLTEILVWDVIYRVGDKAAPPVESEGTEDFPQSQKEGVVVEPTLSE